MASVESPVNKGAQLCAHDIENIERSKDVLEETQLSFTSLLLSPKTLGGLEKSGFKKPSPIQSKAIPIGKCGFDLVVKSKSGTGKTAVFAIIALEMINVEVTNPQVVILAPTREIAVQITEVIKCIGQDYTGLKIEYFIGGLPIEEDEIKLAGCHIAVGAPGRLKHLIERKSFTTKGVRLFVLDEADQLMNTSFQADINYIYRELPEKKQVLALSATYPDKLDTFLTSYMQTPTHISPKTDTPLLLGLKQFIYETRPSLNVIQQMNVRTEALLDILTKVTFTQCLIFSNFQTRAESVSNLLNQRGWNSAYISGAIGQTERLNKVKELKEFKCRILLSTDLTARGIDAANIDLVINYEVPHDASTYLHRMGRAGRYGAKGVCVTISSRGKELIQMQTIIGTIGGSDLSVGKIASDKFPTDLWENGLELERVPGIVEETDEKTIKLRNIKDSLMEMKKVKEENDPTDVLIRLAKGESVEGTKNEKTFNADDVLMRLAGGDEEKVDKIEKGFNPGTILAQLANGENISVVGKVSNCERNVALLNVSNALCGDDDISKGNNLTDYLNALKSEQDETMEKLKSCRIKPDVQETSIENIYQYAYNHAVRQAKPWYEIMGVNLEELKEESIDSPINLLESDEEDENEDGNEDEIDECQDEEMNCEEEENGSELKNINQVAAHKPYQPYEAYLNEPNSNHDYNNNEHFASCFEHYNRMLHENVYSFTNVSDFNNYLLFWQTQVSGVRDYIQQQIYVEEMNRYKYYRYQ